MGKDFLKLKTDQRKLCALVLCGGIVITIGMGVRAFRNTELQNGYELAKNEAGEGSYDQKVIAYVEGQEKIPVTVTVEERSLSKEEAEVELTKAATLLDDILKGENESLGKVTTNLNFPDTVEGTPVEVEWTETLSEYFYSDGTYREDVDISETIELKVSAILSCQEYSKDYEAVITLVPKELTPEKKLTKLIAQEAEKGKKSNVVTLPMEYEGSQILWKKPLDNTFLYFLILTAGAVIFLKVGGKRDEQLEKKERLDELEKDYAQIVSKFTMLLSAGVNVRNAWERIVLLHRGKQGATRVIYEEMNWALREMQKGISELEVYEAFGKRVGQIHYKKLMALFVSDKKRGSINLLDAMNQEMLQAWEEQKRKTRQQGEKIGTKLLVPMMGMLAVVFLMILVPAFLSFQI